MRIKKIKIRNLGKHKHLEAILDGSVVGLMGPNGSGKSTILKLIHFLITGWTPAKETQESFLRKVDPETETEPTQGSAEIEFYAQGNLYRIERRVGSQAGRKLARLDENGTEIKAETFTRADEIQSVLSDILGADKYAIDNAVFPEQGALDKILFGSQAEREELLVKLLLLGHMQKVADVAAGKIKILSSEIQDFSTLYDEIQSNRNAAEVELAHATTDLTRHKSYDSELALFDKWTSAINEFELYGKQYMSAFNEKRKNKDDLAEELSSLSKSLGITIKSAEEIEQWLTKLTAKISQSRSVLTSIRDTKNKVTDYNSTILYITQLKKDLMEAEAHCPAIVDAAVHKQLTQRIDVQRKRKHDKTVLEISKVELDNEKLKFNEFQEQVNSLTEQSNKLAQQLAQLADNISLFKLIVDSCDLALQRPDCPCPVCGEDLAYEQLKNRHAEYIALYREHSGKHKDIQTNKELIDLNLREKSKVLARVTADIAIIEKRIRDAEEYLASSADEDLSDLEDQIAKINYDVARRNEIQNHIATSKERIAQAEKKIAHLSEEDRVALAQTDVALLDAEAKKLEDNIQHWEARQKELRESQLVVNRLAALISAADKKEQEATENCGRLTEQRDALYKSFPLEIQRMLETENSSDVVKEKLQAKNKAHTEKLAKTIQLGKQADVLKARLYEIEAKIRLDEDKRAVITELQHIVAAFSRQGIPMAYVQHKFDSLVTMTQENLEIMDANFAIIPHPNKPVSLQFYRVDEPGQVLFDHEKLSGGQKVRLSIAFLLAVQQLVIPDLGFLVLDEPSTHLDEEARENLKELLLNLSQQLEATDTQILVCDHAKELEPAFVNVIQL